MAVDKIEDKLEGKDVLHRTNGSSDTNSINAAQIKSADMVRSLGV